MTQLVTDASGQKHSFPDEATPGMIAKALNVHPPERGTGRIGMPTSETALTPDVLKYRNRQDSIFPASTDERGNLHFDSHAGILGEILNSLAVPGDVAAGKMQVDLPGAVQQTTGLAMLANPAPAAMRAGEAAIPGMVRNLRQSVPETPAAATLKEVGGTGFDQARSMGVDYTSDSVKTLATGIQHTLEQDGFLAVHSPKTFEILGRLQQPPENSIASLSGLIAARKSLQKAAGDFTNPTERIAANRAIESLDNFIEKASPESVVAGPAAAAGKTLEDARGNYGAAMRSEAIAGKQFRAEVRASAANSGHNVGNVTKQRIADLILNAKEGRGFSKAELAMLQQVVEGKFGSELARHVSSMLGGGGGVGQSIIGGLAGGAGYAAGGYPGAALAATAAPLTGSLIRGLYNKMVKGQLAKVDEAVRQRSPLYEQAVKDAPMMPTDPVAKAALMRALLLLQQGRGPDQR